MGAAMRIREGSDCLCALGKFYLGILSQSPSARILEDKSSGSSQQVQAHRRIWTLPGPPADSDATAAVQLEYAAILYIIIGKFPMLFEL